MLPRGHRWRPAPDRPDFPGTDAVDAELKRCALSVVLGQAEECAGSPCPFWDEGGAVVEPDCALEHLGIDVSDPSLAAYLLHVRGSLERVRDAEAATAAYAQLADLVPSDLAESEPT
jgi:hypothetical protein